MELRLRLLESEGTLNFEVPTGFSLQQLKDILYDSYSVQHFKDISYHRVTSSSSSSIHLSLNGIDEFITSSPQDSLESLGITSNDLIYFSFNPIAFSLPQIEESSEDIDDIEDMEYTEGTEGTEDSEDMDEYTEDMDDDIDDDLDDIDGMIQALYGITDSMDVDDNTEWPAGDRSKIWSKISFEYFFLRRILREEMGADGSDQKLLVIAVHAVMLESGFIGFDSVSGIKLDRLQLFDWQVTTLSIWYTLPELLGNGQNVSSAVILKFRKIENFVNVCGYLIKDEPQLHQALLCGDRFGPTIESVWTADESSYEVNEAEIFEFWKMVKDGISLPLMIDIYEKSGFIHRGCLMGLTVDLKLKILESLRGNDIAKMACVCLEWKYLTSNQDLWKTKVQKEFSGSMELLGETNWKTLYSLYWDCKMKIIREYELCQDDSNFGSCVPYMTVPFCDPYIICRGDDGIPTVQLHPPFPLIWMSPTQLQVWNFLSNYEWRVFDS